MSPDEMAALVDRLREAGAGDDFVVSYRTGWDPNGMDHRQIVDEAEAYAEAVSTMSSLLRGDALPRVDRLDGDVGRVGAARLSATAGPSRRPVRPCVLRRLGG